MRERVWVGGESLGLGHDQSLIDGAQLFLGAKFFGGQECGFPFRTVNAYFRVPFVTCITSEYLESDQQELIRENATCTTCEAVVSNPKRFGIPWDSAIIEVIAHGV